MEDTRALGLCFYLYELELVNGASCFYFSYLKNDEFEFSELWLFGFLLLFLFWHLLNLQTNTITGDVNTFFSVIDRTDIKIGNKLDFEQPIVT